MATETRWASSHLAGTASTPDNANGATDGAWTSDSGNTNWTSRWAMDNPSGALTGTQTINVLVRKDASSGNNPTASVNLYEAGTLVSSLVGTTSVTSATGQTLSGTFDGSAITNADNVEIEVVTTGAGGSPSVRRAVQVDSIEWAVAYSVASRTGTLAATDAVDTASLAGTVPVSGALAGTDDVDTAALAGDVAIAGTAAATDAIDSASFAGTVGDASVSGTLASTDSVDTMAGAGAIAVSGAVSAQDDADTAALAGEVAWAAISGAMATADASDGMEGAGAVLVDGTFAASEVNDLAYFLSTHGVKRPGNRYRVRMARILYR